MTPRKGTCGACGHYDREAGWLFECPEKETGGATGRLAKVTTAHSRPCKNVKHLDTKEVDDGF